MKTLLPSLINLGKNADMDPMENMQHDAAEFYRKIINCLIVKYNESGLQRMFQSTIANVKECISCSHVFVQVYQKIVLNVPVLRSDDPISVKSLLWNVCAGTYTSEREIKVFCPNCKGHAMPGLHDVSLFLHNPTILVISTIRKQDNSPNLTHSPLQVDDILDISDVSVPYDDLKANRYTLFAAINHHGSTMTSGHYEAWLFNNNQATCFDDKRITVASKENVLRNSTFVKNTSMLCYVREKDLEKRPNSFPHPWLLSENQQRAVEKIWFEDVSIKLSCLSIVDIQICSRYNALFNTNLIDAFLQTLNKEPHRLRAKIFTTFFYSALLNQGTSFEVTHALTDPALLDLDVLVIPMHHPPSHWSVLGIYPSLKLMLHCDSLHELRYSVFEMAFEFLNKLNRSQNTALNVDEWTLVSPIDISLQADGYNCGPCTCLNAYLMVNLVQTNANTIDMVSVRYWIVHKAIHFEGDKKLHARTAKFSKEGPFRRCKVKRKIPFNSRCAKMTFDIIQEQFQMNEAESRSRHTSVVVPKDMTQGLLMQANCIQNQEARHNLLTEEQFALLYPDSKPKLPKIHFHEISGNQEPNLSKEPAHQESLDSSALEINSSKSMAEKQETIFVSESPIKDKRSCVSPRPGLAEERPEIVKKNKKQKVHINSDSITVVSLSDDDNDMDSSSSDSVLTEEKQTSASQVNNMETRDTIMEPEKPLKVGGSQKLGEREINSNDQSEHVTVHVKSALEDLMIDGELFRFIRKSKAPVVRLIEGMKSLVPNRKCQSQRLVAVNWMDCEKFKRIEKVEVGILTAIFGNKVYSIIRNYILRIFKIGSNERSKLDIEYKGPIPKMFEVHEFLSPQGITDEEFYDYVVVLETIAHTLTYKFEGHSHREITEKLFGKCLHHAEALVMVSFSYSFFLYNAIFSIFCTLLNCLIVPSILSLIST